MNTKIFYVIVLLFISMQGISQVNPTAAIKPAPGENYILISRDTFGAARFVYDSVRFDISGDTLYFTDSVRVDLSSVVDTVGEIATKYDLTQIAGGDNLFTADGTLTGNREVTMGGNYLTFESSIDTLKINGNSMLDFNVDNPSNYNNSYIGKSHKLQKWKLGNLTNDNFAEDINSYTIGDINLGGGIRKDAMYIPFAYNFEPNITGTADSVVNALDASYLERLETHYLSNDGPTLGKTTMERYNVFLDTLGGGTRPYFWAGAKDGSMTYNYTSAHVSQWLNYTRANVLMKLDDNNSRLTFGSGTNGNIDLYFDYNNGAYIKGKSGAGLTANLLSFNSADLLTLGGANVSSILFPRDVRITGTTADAFAITTLPDRNATPPSKTVVWDSSTGQIGYVSQDTWTNEAINKNLYFNSASGQSGLGLNDNLFDYRVNFADANPATGWKDTNMPLTANQQTFTGLANNTYSWMSTVDPTLGGVYNKTVNLSAAANAFGNLNVIYMENSPTRFGAIYHDIKVHDGSGGVAAANATGIMFNLTYDRLSKFSVTEAGLTGINLASTTNTAATPAAMLEVRGFNSLSNSYSSSFKNQAGVYHFRTRNDGLVQMPTYGSGTYVGTAAKYLAVESDGDVIEVDAPTSTNLYNTDGSLTGNRIITSTGQSLEYSALDGNDINVSTFSDNGNTFAITDTGTGALSNLSQRPEYLKLTSAPMQLVNNDDYQLLWTDVETNSTTKNGGIGSFHYTNSEEPFLALVSQSGSSFNSIRFGGGDSGGNAATVIDFYTASNNTTTTGTRRMRINASGNLGLGLVDPTDKLEVDGVVKINDFIKMVPTATVPTSPASGWIYFDDGTNRTGAGPRYYNGSSWVDL